jgi:outer membrane receptor protein involved in Fe transport
MKNLAVSLSLVVTLLLAANLFAQTETGQITGTITDPTGAVIPGATVTVKSTGTGATRTVSTSADGDYTVANLMPGPYALTVESTGFAKAQRSVVVAVGARLGQDFKMDVAAVSTEVDVTGNYAALETQTQTLGQVVTESEIRELPNLTRNAYQFVALAGNVSDAGMGTRGAGFSINGQRESSTNILLDGASNNDEFTSGIGQQVPLEAVQEFSVLTSNYTAEYGRASGGIVNVVTKSGTNDFHGTAYEFNRVSNFSSNSFQNNATGQPKSTFTRNQFGYSVGGPVVKNKLFFFSSTEWIRVRSSATNFAWVPTADLIAQTPVNTQNFFNAYGQLRSSANVFGSVTRNGLTSLTGVDPCAGLGCASLSGTLPMFNHVAYTVPTDAGGGYPQNTYMTMNRVDYNPTDKTQIYGRYALYSEQDQVGVLSSSPYNNYDLGQTYFNHNALLSLIHTFSPDLGSQTKVVFNRLTNLQQGITSRGVVPTMYANRSGPVTIGSDNIAFPGYNPFTPGNGGAFGGPQNLLQLYQDVSYTRGRHSWRFGASYTYQRDNRTYAAYQTAVDSLASSGLGPAVSGLMAGQFNEIRVAIDPQGKFPCAVNPANCQVSLPASAPSFSRSNRYNEFALYAQDSWRVKPSFTLNLGLRWEYYGVQHNQNPNLDANWYAPGVGIADNALGQYLSTGGLQVAPQSPIGGLWNPDYRNFAPRIGFAWDVMGDGKSNIRAGYGIAYERNFGNVTFNIIQNPPNYAVLGVPGPITTDNFGPFAGTSGTLPLPQVGARIVDPNIRTAYAHMWNASFERQLTRGIVWSLEYSGSKGVHLYSIDYPNQHGFGNYVLGTPCTGIQPDGSTDCTAQLNPAYSVAVGYRGNQGFSIYHGLNNRVRISNILNSGLDLTANYTWSHSIDNLSSTFFEAAGLASQYGNANITINNGNFVYGLLDPFHPNLDRGNSEFDIRHRFTLGGTWKVPEGHKSGLSGKLLGGWSLNPIFVARSGQPFSIFDSSVQMLDLNTPRASFTGPIPQAGTGLIATGTPNVFQYYTFTAAQIARTPMSFAPGSSWPASMSGRDAFRAPGWWNMDAGVYKDTKLTERLSMQLRAETFNLFNHANLYVVGSSADLGSGSSVNACYGCTGSTYDRRHLQLAVKFSF